MKKPKESGNGEIFAREFVSSYSSDVH